MTTHISNTNIIMEKIAALGDNFCCNPFLSREDDIIQFLMSCSGNMAHSSSDGHIYLKQDKKIYKFKTPSPEVFQSQISNTDAAIRAQENLNQFKSYSGFANLSGIPDDKFESLRFQVVNEPIIISKNSVSMMITNKGCCQYLDFVNYTENGPTENCNYSNRSVGVLQHSSDIHQNPYFFHSVKLNGHMGSVALGGVGFSHTPLMSETFTRQRPSMCVYDPEVNTIYILPFQQTRAVLGDTNTALISGVIIYERGTYTLVPVTITSNGTKYNTTDIPTCGMIYRAFNTAYRIIAETSQAKLNAQTVNLSQDNMKKNDSIKTPSTKKLSNVLQFSSTGNVIDSIHSSNFDYQGNMVTFKKAYNPSLFGITKPSVFYGSIMPSQGDIDEKNFYDGLNKASLIILHFNEDDITSFSEECAGLIEKKVTALVILTVNLSDRSKIVETLEGINLSCTKFANQFSIVLAKCSVTGKYYWLRGVRWCHEKIYNFGEEFHDFEATVKSAINKETPFQTTDNSDMVFYRPVGFMDIKTVPDFVKKMPYNEMIKNQFDLVELITQMSVVAPTKSFNEFKLSCLQLLKTKQEESTKTDKIELKSLLQKKFGGDSSNELQKKINNLISKIKKNRACSQMKNLTNTIIGMTSEGAATSKAARKSLENTLRSEVVNQNVGEAAKMTQEDICNYLEGFDQIIVGQINHTALQEALTSVANGTFKELISSILSLHRTCGELDGYTAGALSVQSGQIGHDLEGVLAFLCGESERNSSVPIAVLQQFSELPDPRYFKWVEEVNDPDVAKYRILLRRMICEAACNRTRNISPSSVHLTKFLIAMFISIAQSIKSRFSMLPTDETDFTVVAMRTLLGYTFTTLASGKIPMSNMWQVLSYYPTQVPHIDAFNPDDLWILENLIDMFPYCMWSVAEPTFKKNTLCGITKLLAKYIITSELDKIAQKEREEMFKRNKDIENNLTIVWQWQKLAIISILKMYSFSGNNIETFKRIAKKILEDYPDIDESKISNKHTHSSSSRHLKNILKYILKNGNVNLSDFHCTIIKQIIGKRMHHYYQTKSMTKKERSEYLKKIDMKSLSAQFGKANASNFTDVMGRNIWDKSWSGRGENKNDSMDSTMEKVNEYFSESSIIPKETKNVVPTVIDIVSLDKFSDERQKIWLKVDTIDKVQKFLTKNNITKVERILGFVFPEKNVYTILRDISEELLNNYKDRSLAYGNILHRYRFD